MQYRWLVLGICLGHVSAMVLNDQSAETFRPVVMWHGLGDTCCSAEGMGSVVELVQEELPGVFVHAVQIGSSSFADRYGSFFGKVRDQIDTVCRQLKHIPELKNGFNAVGISQGGLFLRGYVQYCNDPPVHNLVTLGTPHGGVAKLPGCQGQPGYLCSAMEAIALRGMYSSYVQSTVVPAQYFRDHTKLPVYFDNSGFLADLNNEAETKNGLYAQRLASLNTLAMVHFLQDQVITPPSSAWFSSFDEQGELVHLRDQTLYHQDWLGLKQLDLQNKLVFMEYPSTHLRVSTEYLINEIIHPFLNNTLATFGPGFALQAV